MGQVEKSIEVQTPVHVAYNQWTQFESFPRFMTGVEEVRQLDDKRLHWRAKVGGKEKEWDAVIATQEPDRCIAWHNTSGAQNAGRVSFESAGDNATRVTLQMSFDPDGVVENVGDAL
ncbi:MAG: SRPBCC family protein, partial [Dehalococcoidia bacterium]